MDAQEFDVVIMFHVVSDIPAVDRRAFFDRLYQSVVRPDGLLIITTRTGRPDGTQSAESRIMEALNRRPYVDSRCFHALRRLISSVGFGNLMFAHFAHLLKNLHERA